MEMKREDVELVDLTAQEAKVQPRGTVSVVESLLIKAVDALLRQFCCDASTCGKCFTYRVSCHQRALKETVELSVYVSG